MSSSTFACSDDMLTSSPRSDSSGVVPYDSDIDVLSDDDLLTVEEVLAAAKHNGAAMPQNFSPRVASHSNNKHIANTEKCTNDGRFNLEESERAPYCDESDDEKEPASVSTLPKASYRKLLPRMSRAENNVVVKREMPEAESINIGPERHSTDAMQIDSISGPKTIGFEPKREEVDLSRLCFFMPPHDRYKFIDAFTHLYMSSSSSERKYIHARLAELDVGVAPAGDLPRVMAKTEDSDEADLSAPARPVNQMQQSDGTSTGGMEVIDLTDLTSDSDEFEEEVSAGNARFNPSSQSHAPAASNSNNIVPQYEVFYGRGDYSTRDKHFVKTTQAQPYSSSYGPPTTTYVINQFIEGSSRDGLQPPSFLASSTNNHKRPHGLGWDNGRSPLRQRVVSSPGYIESSRPSSTAPPPSGRSSPPLPTTGDPRKVNYHLVDEFFIPGPEMKSSLCVYKKPNGKTCNGSISGLDGSNRFRRLRHLASHAQKEEDAVANGCLKVEDTLLLTRLRKDVVTCVVPGCDFSKEVWHRNKARVKHEKEAHPAVCVLLKAIRRRKPDKKETAKEEDR